MVTGLRQLALACTIGGDNYDYDDTIWADPKLIAADGREVWLTELKAAKAEVGWRTLFVNRNYAGKPLRIGQQEFARGFWAHAPSLLFFDLDGQYEWFDTSFGLDALATTPGTAEFIIADSPDAAAQDLSAVLKTLLLRDFPTSEHRHEIERELADGIWDGVNSGGEGDVLATRYAAAILPAFSLPNDPAGSLPKDVASLRSLYHRVKRLQESLNKLRGFRFEVDVCLGTVGPGAADLVPGVYAAWADSIPMVVLTAQNQTWKSYPERGSMQSLDQLKLFEPITKWSARVTHWQRIPELVQRAFRATLSGRPRPVHLDLHVDVLVGTDDEAELTYLPPSRYRAEYEPVAPAELIAQAARLLVAAQRPLLHPGAACCAQAPGTRCANSPSICPQR